MGCGAVKQKCELHVLVLKKIKFSRIYGLLPAPSLITNTFSFTGCTNVCTETQVSRPACHETTRRKAGNLSWRKL